MASYASNIVSATQCYDLATDTFNVKNADLGPLPEPWWGMADGWMTYEGRYQIWIANGVAQDGTLLPASAYADETTGGFVYGPEVPVGLYSLEGMAGMASSTPSKARQGASTIAPTINFSCSARSVIQSICRWCCATFSRTARMAGQ